jgi:hypothetical protein
MSPEAEAGPSTSVQPAPPRTKDDKPPRKRKAGGDGKKGKIFLEDKVRNVPLARCDTSRLTFQAGLLSLMANVTGSKDTVVKSKLDHQRRRNNPSEDAAETAAAENVDKHKLRNEKKKKDARAFVSNLDCDGWAVLTR